MINGRKVLGVIGGMGPMATADLFRKITLYTDAHSDSEHIHILIDSNTAIPDRTLSILEGSREPERIMVQSALRLESTGADLLVIPCNTAHFYHGGIAASVEIPVLHMPREVASFAAGTGVGTVAVLATDGTVKSGIYDDAFSGYGIRVITPDEAGQKKLMHTIYDEIKAGAPAHTEALRDVLDGLRARGAEAFILGCTELSMAFEGNTEYRMIDSTTVLALAAIREAGYPVKNNAR